MPFLSRVLGRPVLDIEGANVGILRDLLVSPDIAYPPIRAVVVEVKRRLHTVPWASIASMTPRGTALRHRIELEKLPEPGDDLIWLGRDLLDKQIVDTHGIKLVRVNDIVLTPINGDLRLAGVDNSVVGLLRRLGIDWLARPFRRDEPRLIDWQEVDIGPAVDEVRLKVPFDRLRNLPPADISEVISQMSPAEAADVLEALDDKIAADTLTELPDERQAAVLAAMEPEEAADVLEEMAPDEAADVLGDVEDTRASELIRLMAPRAASEVRSLLAYEEDRAGGLMNSRFIAVKETDTVDQVITYLRETAPPEDESYYLYVTDAEGRLRGVLSLRDLIVAPPDAAVSTFMRRDVSSVRLDDSREDVARNFVRYNLLAVPVVDDEGCLRGVVTVDDVLEVVARPSWRVRSRRTGD